MERKMTARQLGPVDVDLPCGTVLVSADPNLRTAMVIVRTSETTGAAVDAVRRSEIIDQPDGTLTVRVPEIRTNPQVFRSGGSNFYFNSGIQNVGSTVTGAQTVVDGVVIGGTVIGGDNADAVEVLVFLPKPAALRFNSVAARLQARGHIDALQATTISGSITVASIDMLGAKTVSGAITADRVLGRLAADTVSGVIEVGSYSGHHGEATSVSGSIAVDATPQSSGALHARTISGRVRLTGASHLRTR